jgi:uncharacterized protein DUF3718
MKKSNTVLTLAIAATLPLLFTALPSQAAMSKYMETALIDVCKAAKSNHLGKYNKISKSYRLKDKTIALKVVCNGDDIISFAEKHGADKTAAKLQRSLGNVSIIDVAAVSKLSVTFNE